MKIFSLLLPLISSQYYPPMGPGMAGGFRPNQRNAYIPENGVMRKVSLNEHHGKSFFMLSTLYYIISGQPKTAE